MCLTNFSGRFLIIAGWKPEVFIEKAAARLVKGRSHAVD
jgi:hypothetical protein